MWWISLYLLSQIIVNIIIRLDAEPPSPNLTLNVTIVVSTFYILCAIDDLKKRIARSDGGKS